VCCALSSLVPCPPFQCEHPRHALTARPARCQGTLNVVELLDTAFERLLAARAKTGRGGARRRAAPGRPGAAEAGANALLSGVLSLMLTARAPARRRGLLTLALYDPAGLDPAGWPRRGVRTGRRAAGALNFASRFALIKRLTCAAGRRWRSTAAARGCWRTRARWRASWRSRAGCSRRRAQARASLRAAWPRPPCLPASAPHVRLLWVLVNGHAAVKLLALLIFNGVSLKSVPFSHTQGPHGPAAGLGGAADDAMSQGGAGAAGVADQGGAYLPGSGAPAPGHQQWCGWRGRAGELHVRRLRFQERHECVEGLLVVPEGE